MKDTEENLSEIEKPIDLKRHQRYDKKSPRKLLLKAAIILILFYLITYGINTILDKQKASPQTTEETEEDGGVEVE